MPGSSRAAPFPAQARALGVLEGVGEVNGDDGDKVLGTLDRQLGQLGVQQVRQRAGVGQQLLAVLLVGRSVQGEGNAETQPNT